MPIVNFTDEEDEILRSLFPNYLAMLEFLPHRKIEAVRRRSRILGLTTRRSMAWTAPEDSIVKSHLPDIDAICSLLPHRTRRAIELRAVFFRISYRHVHRKWETREIHLLHEFRQANLDVAEMAARLGRTAPAVATAIYLHCDDKPKRRTDYKGPSVIRAIRSEARRQGMYLSDLSRSIGTRVSNGRRLGTQRILKAIEVLGGTFTIEWDDPTDDRS